MTQLERAREASKRKWQAIAKSSWHKRVPHDMAAEYVARGWKIHSTHEHFTTLVWPREGTPP